MDQTVDEIGTGRVGQNSLPFRHTSRQESRSVSPVSTRGKRGMPYMPPGISLLPTGQPQLGGGHYDDDMSMYGDDMRHHGLSLEGKKRRGRAAPPGRCHSCNTAETSEWRRGPDGARTLCNACGIHYAKLTRKYTIQQPQDSNGSSPQRLYSLVDLLGGPPALPQLNKIGPPSLPPSPNRSAASKRVDTAGEASMYSESSVSLSRDTDDATEERAFGKNTSSTGDNLGFGTRSQDPLDESLLGPRLSVTRGLRPPPPLAHNRGTHPSNWRVPPPGRPLAQNRAPRPPQPPPPEGWPAAVIRINAKGEAGYSDSDDDYDWEEVSGKKVTSSAKGNETFGPGYRESVDFSRASRAFGRMAGKAWKSSDTYSPVNSTISKDRTMGEFACQAELLANFGQKIKRCVFTSVQREEDEQSELIEDLGEFPKSFAETTTKIAVTDNTNNERTNLGPARLYLGNLPENTTKADLEAHFATWGTGKITGIKLMKGFGFLDYNDPMEARDFVPAFHGSDFMGQSLCVSFARGTWPLQ